MLSILPKTFVTIIDTGSITKAANELNMAKSAISQNLKRLELMLDVKLAVRSTRTLTLTPAGKHYYQKCKDIMLLAQQAEMEMEVYGAEPSGAIKITAPHALIKPILVPAISRVLEKFPKLEPMVVAEDKRLDLIAEGIDLSITVGKLPDSNLKARRIGTLNDALCVSSKVIQDAPPVSATEFMPWIHSIPYIAHTREEKFPLNFKPALKSNTIDGLSSFVREGMGIALLPDVGISNDLKEGKIVQLKDIYDPVVKPIHAVHAYDVLPPKSVQFTIEVLKDILRKSA